MNVLLIIIICILAVLAVPVVALLLFIIWCYRMYKIGTNYQKTTEKMLSGLTPEQQSAIIREMNNKKMEKELREKLDVK